MEKPSNKYSKAIAFSCALLIAGTSMSFMPSNETTTVEAAGNSNYAKGLQYSMYLYDANMCGTEVGENSAMDWRDDCHTNDAKASTPYGTLDLSGGYHDAGDHVKFGLPQAYSASILGWGYYEFKEAYSQTGQDGHMKTISTYFADYFKNCTVMDSSGKVTAFCYQVGDGDSDHAEWCSPESQNIARPTYFATSSNPATDIVANTVGALAFHYKNFGDTESLTYAKALYNFAKSNSKACASEGIGSFYAPTDAKGYVDDLMWAAASLYIATGDKSYISDASQFLTDSGNAYIFCSDWPLCWGNMWPAVNLIFGKSGGVTGPYGDLKSDMMSQVSKTLDGFKGKTTLDGTYVCFDDWGSARYNTAMQLVGLVYDKYNNSSTYTTWAKSQMDYLMGDNSKNLCYITGFADNSVTNPHHRAASGLSTFPTENATINMGHTLIGALVGGPMKDGSYEDKISLYKYTEVAIDYNAGFVGAMAGLYLKYGSGQQVDSSIEGVNGSNQNPVETTVTTTVTEPTTTTSNSVSETTNQSETSQTSQGVDVTTSVTSVTTSQPTSSETLPPKDVDEIISNSGTVTVPISSIITENNKSNVASIQIDVSSVSGNNIGDVSGQITIDTENGGLNASIPSLNYANGTINVEIPSGTTLNMNGNVTINVWWTNNDFNVNSVSATITGNSQGSQTTVPSEVTTSEYHEATTSISVVEEDKSIDINQPLTPSDKEANTYEIKFSDLIPNGSTLESLTFKVSSADGSKIGTVTGGYVGLSVADGCPNATDYWYTVDEQYEVSSDGNSIEVTWVIPDEVKPYINSSNIAVFGVWWADCGNVILDSVTATVSNETVVTEPTQTQGIETTIVTTVTTPYTYTTSQGIDTTVSTSNNVPVTTTTTTTTTVSSDVQITTSNNNTSGSSTLIGDINDDGKVNGKDLMQLKKYVLGLISEDSIGTQGMANADINNDGKVNGKDLMQLKKYVLGLVTSL